MARQRSAVLVGVYLNRKEEDMKVKEIYKKQTGLNPRFKWKNRGHNELEDWNDDYVEWLESRINALPCTCSEEYKSRKLNDPNCVRCNNLIGWQVENETNAN